MRMCVCVRACVIYSKPDVKIHFSSVCDGHDVRMKCFRWRQRDFFRKYIIFHSFIWSQTRLWWVLVSLFTSGWARLKMFNAQVHHHCCEHTHDVRRDDKFCNKYCSQSLCMRESYLFQPFPKVRRLLCRYQQNYWQIFAYHRFHFEEVPDSDQESPHPHFNIAKLGVVFVSCFSVHFVVPQWNSSLSLLTRHSSSTWQHHKNTSRLLWLAEGTDRRD